MARIRVSQGSTERKFDEIAPEEIANAILSARQLGHMHDVNDVHRVARDLGYGRVTENIKSIIDRVVSTALPDEKFTRDFLGSTNADN